jgi:ABC-type Fe3+-siderophore transport system permease subunit
MDARSERPLKASAKGNKAPFEVHFAVWALLVTIIGIDVLGVLVVVEMVREQGPAWVPWLSGFILLLLSVIGISYVQTLKDGDRDMRNYVSYSVLIWGFGFSWPPSWRWLLFLVPVILIVPLWLPRSRRFFDEATGGSSSPDALRKEPGPDQ